jgi:hypothetical protein
MKRINDTQKQFEQLTNELESLINVRLILMKTLNYYLINNINIFIDYKDKKIEKDTHKILILIPKEYEIDNSILGAIRDINIKQMTKLKNEKNMKEFTGISGEYSEWKKHFLFRILRNSG